MAVNFVAVGDGFCVTAERSVDPRHSTRAAAERLSAVGALGEQERIFCSLSVQNIHDESPLDCHQLEDHHHGQILLQNFQNHLTFLFQEADRICQASRDPNTCQPFKS